MTAIQIKSVKDPNFETLWINKVLYESELRDGSKDELIQSDAKDEEIQKATDNLMKDEPILKAIEHLYKKSFHTKYM